MVFYFDENISQHICYALNALEQRDGLNECVYIPDIFGRGEEDEVILETLSQNEGIYVTQDYDFRKITMKYELSKQLNIGLIQYKPPSKGYDFWEITKVFIKYWPDLKASSAKLNKPFFLRFRNRTGVEQVQ